MLITLKYPMVGPALKALLLWSSRFLVCTASSESNPSGVGFRIPSLLFGDDTVWTSRDEDQNLWDHNSLPQKDGLPFPGGRRVALQSEDHQWVKGLRFLWYRMDRISSTSMYNEKKILRSHFLSFSFLMNADFRPLLPLVFSRVTSITTFSVPTDTRKCRELTFSN